VSGFNVLRRNFDPNWTLGDAMDHLSQALGYPSQTLEPPATFKAE